ncbi:monovalent cation/H(+) antiporter subunit G (plasmid) [Rhodobacteraceae bacterium SC52]|nr:monovalent cation/H(+) antiporter subunit G [Rhodobacteraceae bacterium SC52]
MSTVLDILGTAMMTAGTGFLLMAAFAFWRLPDLLSRLHALTKADTAGVALIVCGAACMTSGIAAVLSLVLCGVLVALSGATTGHLIAQATLEDEERA